MSELDKIIQASAKGKRKNLFICYHVPDLQAWGNMVLEVGDTFTVNSNKSIYLITELLRKSDPNYFEDCGIVVISWQWFEEESE